MRHSKSFFSFIIVNNFIFLLIILELLFLFSCGTVADTHAKFTNVSTKAMLKSRPLRSYGNPVWGDFDNDGNLDIALSNHTTPEPFSLYHNNGNGTFSNVLNNSGISILANDIHGLAWGDYDNDGNLDLYIAVAAASGKLIGHKTDELWKGDGNGHFTNITDSAGVNNAYGRARSPFWVDYNNDGYIDLFVVNLASDSVLYKNNGNGTFTNVTVGSGLDHVSGHICSWADYNNDGFMDLFITDDGTPDRLYKNNGDGTFTNSTLQAGLNPTLIHGSGIAWGDYNNDGNLDLYFARGYIANIDSLLWSSSKIVFLDQEILQSNGIDFVTNGSNVTFNLYINNKYQPDKVFIGQAKTTPVAIPLTISNADGIPVYTKGIDLGFFIWKDISATWHLRYNSNGVPNTYYGILTTDGSFSMVTSTFNPINYNFKDTLYKNNGDGTFANVTDISGVGNRTGNHMAAIWGDYNNDGYLDLYVTDSGDISGNKPNILYKNNRNGTFTDVAAIQGVEALNVLGRHLGAAWGDYNNDGYLDIWLRNGLGQNYPLSKGYNILLRNGGYINHWLKVKLVGTVSNRLGIGAKLTLNINGNIQFREVTGGGGGELNSQGNVPVHFGLRNATNINSLTIKWPSGKNQTLTNIPVDQTITVVEQ